MENSWGPELCAGRKQIPKLFLPGAMWLFVHLTGNLVSSHVLPIHTNQFFSLLTFLLNNPGWYLRPVDFYLYFQRKPRSFQVVGRTWTNLSHDTSLTKGRYAGECTSVVLLSWSKRESEKAEDISVEYSSLFF